VNTNCANTTEQHGVKRHRWLVAFAGAIFGVLSVGTCKAQDSVPVITGSAGFIYSKDAGQTALQPIINPILLFPLGSHFLVEADAILQGFVARPGPGQSYEWQGFSNLGYLQLDYVLNSHVTIVAGRFLTPFNIYEERLGPIWIHNFQDDPIIFPIGTRTSGASDGAMVRGVAVSRANWLVNYTAFFSALNTSQQFQAGRAFGTRVGVFLPNARLEIGTSYQRFLQDQHSNIYGVYWAWRPVTRVDIKGEYAHSPQGQGYWLEAAYRFDPAGRFGRELKNIQPVIRGQQFVRLAPGVNDSLPRADTQRVDFGLNYYFPHEVRLNGSYGRQFSSTGDSNNWTLDLTYRFLFPMPFWPKGAK
jgi:hypothetical protein